MGKLRQADVELGKGKRVPEVCRLLEISEQTYYRWRQKYGGMAPEMAKQVKSLDKEKRPFEASGGRLGLGHPDSEGGGPAQTCEP